VATFLSDAIHSVSNEGDRTTLWLHVYGTNLNFAERSRFDPQTGAETPFKLKLE
jgi:predicted metal-dependent enzyme (double-stranded beta helix superfamily)